MRNVVYINWKMSRKQLMKCCIAISCQTECLIEWVFVLLVQSYKTYEIDLILIYQKGTFNINKT